MIGVRPSHGVVLAQLRAATRPAHDRMEGTLGLLDEALDRDAYRLVLERFYGFWRGWEPQVADLLADPGFTRPRRRAHLLIADLAALGLSRAAIDGLPPCPLPVLGDAAAALGSLYVMEGSTLGGRVIQRHVEVRLGLDHGDGCRYFAGYAAQTGPMWRSFLARLDEAPEADADGIANGATATFDCLSWWLSRPAAC